MRSDNGARRLAVMLRRSPWREDEFAIAGAWVRWLERRRRAHPPVRAARSLSVGGNRDGYIGRVVATVRGRKAKVGEVDVCGAMVVELPRPCGA